MRGFPALITDNRLSRDYQRLDNKLAVGLAAMEAGMRDRVDSGSLAETVASFGSYSNGWFGMRVMSRRLDVNTVPQLGPGWMPRRMRRSELVVVNDDAKQLSWATKKAMWDILDPNRQDMNLANHDFIHGESVMRMVVTLPVEAEGLAEVEGDVRDQLDREDFELAYPNLTWSFASANFEETPGERHMHVSLLYPLQTENIDSITDIMHDSYTPAHLADGLRQTRVRHAPLHGGQRQHSRHPVRVRVPGRANPERARPPGPSRRRRRRRRNGPQPTAMATAMKMAAGAGGFRP